jgi:outer membrane receptor for ferrienterochelin and colicins
MLRRMRIGMGGGAAFLASVLGVAVWSSDARADAPPADSPSPADEPEGTGGASDDLNLMKLLNVEVSTATKTAESLDDAPAVITVVTREEIVRWGYRDVAEVLNHTVGFFAIDDHILPNVAVRGTSGGLGAESGVIKVMIDGRTVAFRTTSGNWLGIELVPLESVAQIEIIRGPASALYGADAFLGVVNIITLKPDEVRPLQAHLGPVLTHGHLGGRFDAVSGAKIGKIDFMLGAAGETTNRSGLLLPSESPAPTFPSWVGTRRVADDLQRRSLVLQGRVGYEDPGFGRVSAGVYLSALERGGDFAHWAQLSSGVDASGRKAGSTIGLQQLRVTFDSLYHLQRHLDLAVQGSFAEGGVLPSDRIEIGSDVFYVKRRQSYRAFDGLTEARWLPSSRFNLIAGVEASSDSEELLTPQRIDRSTEASVGLAGDDKKIRLSNLGAYLSSNLKVVDPWIKLTGGIRLDENSNYGRQITGRAGLTSRWSSAFVAKVLYGSAFKAPSPYLLYASPLRPGDVVGNPSLKPQFVHTVELQLSYKPDRFFGITSGVSNSWLIDKAEFTPQGINQAARNVASQRSLSWETRADLRHYNDYNVYASFEIIQSTRDLGQEGYAASLIGTRNVVYPAWIARGGVSLDVPLLPSLPLDLGIEAMVVGPRRAADTSIVERGASYDLPTYLVLDATLATRELYLFKGHESRIAFRGKNILGAKGPNPGPSGFEYPLPPVELFLEFRDTL